MVSADFEATASKQAEVAARWNDPPACRKSAINNIAHVIYFSSDRPVREYAEEIWQVPLPQ